MFSTDKSTVEHDGFVRIAAATPHIRVADIAGNADAIVTAAQNAAARGAAVLVLPELCLTGYTAADLFFDRTMLRACNDALEDILSRTAQLPLLFTIGLPVAAQGALYNVAAVCCRGRLLGLTAKSHLPNYGEFYERRWFTPAPTPDDALLVEVAGQEAPLSSRVVYRCADEHMEDLLVGVEVCEDLWVAAPPSTDMAQAGATVILNASASDEIIGKAEYRRSLIANQSARLWCAYAYADAGAGESTTDMVFAGANVVADAGTVVAETKLFTCDMAACDVDLDRIQAERRRSTTWVETCASNTPVLYVDFSFEEPFSWEWNEERGEISKDTTSSDQNIKDAAPAELLMHTALECDRVYPRTPFVPVDAHDLTERCEEIFTIQAGGLATRLAHTGTKHAVIGLSGGLDSTLALLVTVRAFDMLNLPRTGILAVSMPGFGTTHRTKSNAERLAEGLSVAFREIPINAAVEQHFRDIEHDPSAQDVTYENSQARERTQILMDLANQRGGFVIGTGDLSELALGWATYNGDHMSMYAVNASVPKTLVRHLVHYAAGVFGGEIEEVLLDVLATPVSPELLPPTGDGQIAQKTEDLVGPYELHDFFLYYLLRFGFAPTKIFRMACRSFKDVYEPVVIHQWLRTFYRRFFAQQFKRSCLPDGPKVGSVTLSPRGDWRMPSDAASTLWLKEIDNIEVIY